MSTPRPTPPRRALRVVLGLALAIAIPASGAAAPSAGALRACIANGLTRYTVPDRSAVAQYVDVASACRSALQGGDSAQVTVTPLGRSKKTGPAKKKRAAGPATATAPKRATTTAAVTPQPPPAASSTTTGRATPAAPPAPAAARRARRAPARTATHPRPVHTAPSASVVRVRAALAEAERAGPAAPGALGSSPVWPIVVGALGLVAVVGGIGLRLWRRPR